MKKYNSYELQDISADFRSVASRLSNTDYSQCDTNLKRFMNYLEQQEIVKAFIDEHNTVEYDIPSVVKNRKGIDPFEISAIQDEEISLEVQMLRYAVDNFDGDFTRLYGTFHYTSYDTTAYDEMKKFIDHIIDPLIDYIADHLHRCYQKAKREEGEKDMKASNVTATNSTIVIGSKVKGDVTNYVTITETEKADALDIINTLRDEIEKVDFENKQAVQEMLEEIKADVEEDKKPKKIMLTALKIACPAIAAIAPLVKTLIDLFA